VHGEGEVGEVDIKQDIDANMSNLKIFVFVNASVVSML
jgi:hypothetical protein